VKLVKRDGTPGLLPRLPASQINAAKKPINKTFAPTRSGHFRDPGLDVDLEWRFFRNTKG
jgi:hypothetical protein